MLVLGGILTVGVITHWSFQLSKHSHPTPGPVQCNTDSDCPLNATCTDNQCISHRHHAQPHPKPKPKGDSHWWMSVVGQTYGPYDSPEEMQSDLLEKGISISPSSQVWRPGSTEWVAAFTIPGLVSLPDQVCGGISLGDTSVTTDGTTIPLTWDVSLSGAGKDCFSHIGSGAFTSSKACSRETELTFVGASSPGGEKKRSIVLIKAPIRSILSLAGQTSQDSNGYR